MLIHQELCVADPRTESGRATLRLNWWHRLGLPCVLVAVTLSVYLLNGRFVEATDTFGNELLPLSLLQHGTLTFDQYFVPPNTDGAYPTGEAAPAGVPHLATGMLRPLHR
jgi:hypothetical protein